MVLSWKKKPRMKQEVRAWYEESFANRKSRHCCPNHAVFEGGMMSLKYCFSNGFVFGRWVVCGSLSQAEENEETEREEFFKGGMRTWARLPYST